MKIDTNAQPHKNEMEKIRRTNRRHRCKIDVIYGTKAVVRGRLQASVHASDRGCHCENFAEQRPIHRVHAN